MKMLVFLLILIFPAYLCAQEKKEIILGIFPYVGVSQVIKTYAPVKQYLEKELGAEVVIVSAKNFNTFVSRTSKQKYDIIFTAPHFALKAEREKKYERLLRFSGEFYTLVVVPEDSVIRGINDLAKWTIYMPDSLALVTFVGSELFQKQGLYANRNISFVSALSHKNVLLNILKKKQVAGLVSSNIYQAFQAKNQARLRVILTSHQIPSAMFMMNVALPENLKKKLKAVMSLFENSEYGKKFFSVLPVNGLQKITDEDMREVSQYTELLESMLQ